MKILVTGGAGFLGKHLCRDLAKHGHEVVILDLKDNPEFPTVIGDVRSRDDVIKALPGVEAVFHLASLIEAGESVKFPQKFVDYNISGTVTLLEAMREQNITYFSFSSSAAIYGEPQRTPILEDDRTMPINPYGMTKLAMEALLSSYVKAHGFTGVALRYFNLYGPEENHEPETHAIPRFISQIYHGEEVTIWGNGEHLRDYIYISDIVSAHLAALNYAHQNPQKYHYYNLSTSRPTKVIDVVNLIAKIMNKPANIKHFPDRPGDPLVLMADPSKAQRDLGWTAQVELETGLKQTVEYFLGRFAATTH